MLSTLVQGVEGSKGRLAEDADSAEVGKGHQTPASKLNFLVCSIGDGSMTPIFLSVPDPYLHRMLSSLVPSTTISWCDWFGISLP